MKQIQIWLGHSTFSTTADIYAHLDFAAQEQSAAAMSGMFQRRETPTEYRKTQDSGMELDSMPL